MVQQRPSSPMGYSGFSGAPGGRSPGERLQRHPLLPVLLPLPVLDGGHITFSLIELLTFRRIPAQVYESVTLVFGVLLLSLMAFVFYNDVRSIPLLRSVFSQETVVQTPLTNRPPAHAAPTPAAPSHP